MGGNVFLAAWALLAASLGLFLMQLRGEWDIIETGGRSRRTIVRAGCLSAGATGCFVSCGALDNWHFIDPAFGGSAASYVLRSPAMEIGFVLILVGVVGSLIPPTARRGMPKSRRSQIL
jgi:hypothetical protein